MNNNRFKACLMLWLTLLLAFAQSVASKELSKVTLDLYWSHQFEFAGFYAAKQQGFFQQAGIEVEFTELSSHDDYVKRVTEGKAQFGLAGVDLITRFHQGANVKLLASYFKRSPLVLITQPEISTLKQLEGQAVAGPQRLLMQGGIRNMLNFNQVEPRAINSIKTAQPITLFKNKQIAGMLAFISNEPYQLNKQNLPYRIYNPNQYGIATMDMNLFTSQEFAQANPILVKKFTDAANLGWQYALTHIEQTVELILAQYNTQHKTKEELLFEAVETAKIILPELYEIGSIDRTQLKVIAESLLANQVLTKLRNINTLLNLDKLQPAANFVIANTTTSHANPLHLQLWAQLTKEEQQFLAMHPMLTVQSEANNPPYNFIQNAQPTGYSMDYLQLLADILKVKFNLIANYSWPENIDLLKNNELDLLINIVATSQRRQWADFTPAISQIIDAITVKGDKLSTVNSLTLWAGKKIAVIKDFYYEEILRQHYPDINLVLVNNALEGLTLVSNDLADAYIDSLGSSNYFIAHYHLANLVPVAITGDAHFANKGIAIATNQQNPLLNSILTKAVKLVPDAKQLQLAKLWYLQQTQFNPLKLTEEEQQYLAQHPVLSVQSEGTYPPYDYTVNGIPVGFSVDHIKLIAKSIGVKLKFITGYQWQDYLDMLKEGQLDLMINIEETSNRTSFARFSPAINYSYYSLVVKNQHSSQYSTLEQLQGKTLAVVNGYTPHEILTAQYPQIKLITVNNVLDGISLVASNQADAFIETVGVNNYFIKNYNLSDLTTTLLNNSVHFPTIATKIATNKNNPLLTSIIKKAVLNISEEQNLMLKNKWFVKNQVAVSTIQLSPAEQQYLAQHPVLKVQSEANYPPFNFINQGKPTGYSIDYLTKLGEMLNIKFDYVTGATWAEYLEMLQNNTLDLMINIVDTPERAQFANFSPPVTQALESLVINKDHAIQLTSLTQFNQKKIAVVKKFYQEEILRKFYPDIHLVEVDSVLEGLTAVSNGSVDGFIENLGVNNYFITHFYLSNLRTIALSNNPHFPVVNTRIATNKQNTLLESIFNKAVPLMPEEYTLSLSRKWFNNKNDNSEQNKLTLTIEEQNYLQQHSVIKVQNEMDFPPFNFMLDGKPTGYSIDYINLIAKKLGLAVQFVQHKRWDEYLVMLQQNELDAMVNITNTDERQQFARFTTPYIESSNAVIVRNHEFDANIKLESLANKRIAIVKGYASSERISKLLSDAHLIEFANIPAALEAVANQRADAFFGVRAVASYYIDKNFLSNLTLTNITGEPMFQATPVAIAVNKANPVLLSLLQKAINSIPEPELIKLRQQWMNSGSQKTPSVLLTPQERHYLSNKQHWKVNMIADFPPFSFISNGENQGFSVDLITTIARMLDVQLEFVPGTWSEHLKMLLDGKLDILLNVVNTQDRREIVRFTQPYLETRDVIVMRTNQPHIEATLTSFNGRTIAGIKDYAITNYIKSNFPKIQLLMVNSAEQALLAVSEGRADGHIANEIVANHVIHKNFISNLQVIPVIESETLGKATLSMAVPSNARVFRSIIDKAMLAIAEPELINLRKKWFGEITSASKALVVTSKQQKQWLITHDRQSLYLPELGLPLSHKTAQDYEGIIPDFVNYFKQRLAIDWDDTTADGVATTLANADIVIADQLDRDLSDKFIFSEPISTMPIVALSADANLSYIDDLSKLSPQLAGMLRDAHYQEPLTKRYPALQWLQFDDVSSALMAVNRGDISLMLCPLAVCTYAMNELGLNNLRIINQTDINHSLHFGIRKDWPELVDIINQALTTMSPQIKNSIYRRWNNREDVLVKTDYSLIWYLLIIALTIISVVIAWNRRIAKYAHKIELAHEELKNTQQQLVQSEKMASLGTLTAGVAHEINNPTNFTYASVFMMKDEIDAIKQFFKQLAGGDNAEPQLIESIEQRFTKLIELADTATDGTQRIKNIVNNLRTFTRLDSTERKSAVVTELILATVNLVQTQYNDININTQFSGKSTMDCYPAKLAQVFMNLIVNACQAILSQQQLQPELQGQVNITTQFVNKQLVISFQDNGCGMDKKTQQRVFEPFFTTKDVGSGTGLGMAISFGIIEEHHGMIEIESNVGQGSTITLHLPVL